MFTHRFIKLSLGLLLVLGVAVAFNFRDIIVKAKTDPTVDHTFHTPPMSDYKPVDHSFHTPPMSDYRPVDHSFHTPPMSDYRPVDHSFHTPPMSDYKP